MPHHEQDSLSFEPALRRLGLYAPIEPYRTGWLPVTGGHELYFEECGNPHGRPVVVVHGGPGGGCNPTMRRLHDPSRYRIILFDQRGCGRSIPHASLDENTTWHLIEDMEQLRKTLGVRQWQLFGGSWGSTLSLLYAQAYPDRVLELVLRGIFLLRKTEIDWFYRDGANWLFPEAYKEFLAPIPAAEQDDILSAYHQRLTGSDRAVQLEAARAWSRWEATTLSLKPNPERLRFFASDAYAIAFARIECHYFRNAGFLSSDGEILDRAHRIASLPGTIVQGRFDLVTPPKSAMELKQAWPAANLEIVPDAGHALTEPGIIHGLVSATRRYSKE